MQRVLLTGAGGFIGRALAAALPRRPTCLPWRRPLEERLAGAPLEGPRVPLAARAHYARERDAAAFRAPPPGKRAPRRGGGAPLARRLSS